MCCAQPATSYLSPSARCAPVNGLAGCYVSTIGKPHEYFDLTACLRSTKNVSCFRRKRFSAARALRERHRLRANAMASRTIERIFENSRKSEPVLSENANGAARSNPRGVLKTRGDQPDAVLALR